MGKHCWHLRRMASNGPRECVQTDSCCWCGGERVRILESRPPKKGSHGEALDFVISRRVIKSTSEPADCIRQGSLFESLSKKGASS